MSARQVLSHTVVEYLHTVELTNSLAGSDLPGNATIQMDDQALMILGVSLVESTIEGLTGAISFLKQMGVGRVEVEECALQSYLFLGFPRMITALEILAQLWPDGRVKSGEHVDFDELAPSNDSGRRIWRDGLEQCRVIYGKKFDDLATYMYAVSPTLLQWMIQEGYGKVLSRPGLELQKRELLNVSMLLLEERERQLFAHIRGAMNSGISPLRLTAFIDLHAPFSAAGTHMATNIVARLSTR